MAAREGRAKFERGPAFRPWRSSPRGPMASRKRSPQPTGPVTAADVIEFIETVCFIPGGKFVGQPLRLQPWQKDILRSVYDNPAGTRRAIISMGRKNSKSTLAACLVLAHLCGPPARNRPNAELYSAAQSREQAGIVFKLACDMISSIHSCSRRCRCRRRRRRCDAPSLARATAPCRPMRTPPLACRRASSSTTNSGLFEGRDHRCTKLLNRRRGRMTGPCRSSSDASRE